MTQRHVISLSFITMGMLSIYYGMQLLSNGSSLKYLLVRSSDQHCETESNASVSEVASSFEDPQVLNQRLLEVFGQDSLWQRTQQHYAQPVKRFGKTKKNSKTHRAESTAPNPFSASWSTLSSLLPFSNDLDLGANSSSDVYVQFLAKKKWVLMHHLDLDTEQVFRYGSNSKNYSETNLNLKQKLSDSTLFASQFNVTKTQDEDFTWRNTTFHQLSLSGKDKVTYGVLTSGIYEKQKKDVLLSQWGPYLSWRRPLWRNWLFMQNDLNYTDDLTDQNGYHFSYQMSFEANF
ncbi:selenocysteine synthase [Acinetobacter soli]|uniref:selenocysteine synthase n=1 Tax=Acinetobacter soli TaxID=487316 RepID=UPI00370C4897